MTSKWQAEESEGIRSCDCMHAAPNGVKLSHSLSDNVVPPTPTQGENMCEVQRLELTQMQKKQHEVKQHTGFLKEPCAGHRTNRNTSPNAPDPNKDPRLMAERGSSPEVIICACVLGLGLKWRVGVLQTQQGH